MMYKCFKFKSNILYLHYSKKKQLFFNYSTENLGWTCLAVMKIMLQTKYTLNFGNYLFNSFDFNEKYEPNPDFKGFMRPKK